MKRYGYLFERICSLDNLRVAAYNAAQGKRRRDEVQKFFADLENNLQEIRTELLCRTYRTSPYEVFIKYEPKRREIYKLPFKDRVVRCPCIRKRLSEHRAQFVNEKQLPDFPGGKPGN